MMKYSYIAVGLLGLLLCLSLTLPAAASEPPVRLPTQLVTMRAVHDETSYFKLTLSNIPAGFDVINGTYPGWCVQRDTLMTLKVNHTVVLYSSYDPAMPMYYQNPNWDKVNYLINHKNGSKESIQNAIWYFICNYSYPSNDTQAQAMIAAANAADNVSSFIPQAGESIAILIDLMNGEYSIQRTFFELPLPSLVILGDLVWNDFDADGIQDAGEPGIPGITVSLHSQNGTQVDSVTTDIHGYYSFGIFDAGNYSIAFTLPSGYLFSPKDRGTDDTKDSDVDPQTGRTSLSPFDPLQYNTSWDAGMYVPAKPDTPGVPTPQEESNHHPTADGTVGEPYKAFIGEELHFNGSRSYDRDGKIVLWHWSFGDGTSANGTTVTHIYTTEGTYQVSLTVTDNDGATDTYTTVARIKQPNRPPFLPTITGPGEGTQNISYIFSMVTTDPDDDTVRYLILWGDGSQNTSLFFESGQGIQTLHAWNVWGFYTIQVYAQDPSNVSSDTTEVRIAIGVRYVGSLGYLINTDGSGPFDVFYSNLTQNQTTVQQQQTGVYLIDTTGDGSFDYQYDPLSGSFKEYPGQLGSEYMMLLVGMGVVIVLLLLVSLLWNRRRKKPKL
jgi:hypothetical protein